MTSLFNYIPLLQLCNARVTRHFFLCKGVGTARLCERYPCAHQDEQMLVRGEIHPCIRELLNAHNIFAVKVTKLANFSFCLKHCLVTKLFSTYQIFVGLL